MIFLTSFLFKLFFRWLLFLISLLPSMSLYRFVISFFTSGFHYICIVCSRVIVRIFGVGRFTAFQLFLSGIGLLSLILFFNIWRKIVSWFWWRLGFRITLLRKIVLSSSILLHVIFLFVLRFKFLFIVAFQVLLKIILLRWQGFTFLLFFLFLRFWLIIIFLFWPSFALFLIFVVTFS